MGKCDRQRECHVACVKYSEIWKSSILQYFHLLSRKISKLWEIYRNKELIEI